MGTVYYTINATKIWVAEKVENKWFEFVHESKRKHWYSSEREEREYVRSTIFHENKTSVEQFLEDNPECFIERDNESTIYYKPFVAIKYGNDIYRFYCKTKEDAKSLMEYITQPSRINFNTNEIREKFNLITIDIR